MNIVYLANSIVPSRAANSIHVMKMCQAFAKNGHEVYLIVPHRPEREYSVEDVYLFYDVDPCFEIINVPCPVSSLGTFISNYLMGRKAAGLDPDLVYGRSIISCYFASLRGLPTVYESHAPITDGQFGRVKEKFFNRLTKNRNSRGLVVISEALQRYYEKNYPHLSGKILVARDGADPVDDSKVPIQLETTGTRLQVGYVGHLYNGRGMNTIAEISRQSAWADFHIIGGEPEDVEDWQSKLVNVDNVTFYGFLPPSELDKYRLAFDVQVAPYQKDLETRGGSNTLQWMSPLKIFEYMAAGSPIVASDLPAIREILEHRQTALLCDPKSTTQWIEAIKLLDSNPELRARIGQKAQAEFTNRYTWSARARKIINQLDLNNL